MFIRKNVKYVKTNSSEKDRQMTDLCNCEQILLSWLLLRVFDTVG